MTLPPLRPWTTPSFVTVDVPPEDSKKHPACYPLDRVPAEILSRMCDDYRATIFAKANQPDPKLQ